MRDAPSDTPFPLCANQERVLLAREWVGRFHGRKPSPQLIRLGLRFSGTLSVTALQRTLSEIAQRHAGLRVIFTRNPGLSALEREERLLRFARTRVLSPGSYVQQILHCKEPPFRYVDFSERDPAQQDSALRRLIRHEDDRAFDSEEAPRIRSTLIRIAPSEHLLIVVLDHLVSDHWSKQIIRKEIRALYRHFSEGAASLAPPQTSFPEFALWQDRARRLSYFDSAQKYWAEQWRAYGKARISFGDFAFARPPFNKLNGIFETLQRRVGEADSETIRAFARRSKTTSFVVFLSALAIVLSRHTGKPSVALWTHLANRTRPGVLDVVGYLANSHILAIDLSSNPSVEALLRHVHLRVAAAVANQEVPDVLLPDRMAQTLETPDAQVLIDFTPAHRDQEIEHGFPESVQIEDATLPESRNPRFSKLGIYITDLTFNFSITARYSKRHFEREPLNQLLEDFANTVLDFVSGGFLSRDP